MIVFDVETGGLDGNVHPVIQFAGIALGDDWKELEAFEIKIRFDVAECDARALEVNSYTPEAWRDAVGPVLAIRKICEFFARHAHVQKISAKSGRPYLVAEVCAHNARFDSEFLSAWIKRVNGSFVPAALFEALDTLALARWVSRLSGVKPKSHKLGDLCEWLGIAHEDAHDALGDVRATAKLAQELSRQIVTIGALPKGG
jgi:DNA polymerase III alpha subunit (gram-positive type)